MSLPAHDLHRFAEKYDRARQVALQQLPQRGTSGLELEWNLLDSRMRPLQTVGIGPDQRSFVDVLRGERLPAWLGEQSQLEVFHWMIEFATRPYYLPGGAVYESRLLEAGLLNALADSGRAFGERLYASHGNLFAEVVVDHASIPGGWNLAKRRYLERCVDLYGDRLATAGIHANLSLPEPLLEWEFMHQPPGERGDEHLDGYRSRVYVEATRLLRAFAGLFVATAASTPLRLEAGDGEARVVLTENDSNRNLIFPSPDTLDIPELYRSHADYLRLSYDLVQRGVRFGNNNWTAVRARSFVEPVERLIAVTSDQLHDLYRSGLYASGESVSGEEIAGRIEKQNLRARIDLPMARVEVRTDEGGHPLEVDVANLLLKQLLVILFVADPVYGRAFRYDHEDLARARRNERRAARQGLRAEIEDPFSGKPLGMRQFLRRTLEELSPLAEALGWSEMLSPLREMAAGAPNTAEQMRSALRQALGGEKCVPTDMLRGLAEARERQVAADVERIAAEVPHLGQDGQKLQEMLARARDHARRDPDMPIRFRPPLGAFVDVAYPDKTSEIVDLARRLIRIPSVTNAPRERQRLDAVQRAATFLYDYLQQAGLDVRSYDAGHYPSLLASFPGRRAAPVMLCGHFDVVEPDPDDSQFEPRLEGDYLWGRGAADMKTVVATYLVWMKDQRRRSAEAFPPVNLLLVGNEEIGEGEPSGSPHVLSALAQEGYAPGLLIAGERTGERGDELLGEICPENRGLLRLELVAHGMRGHTGVRAAHADLSSQLFQAREDLLPIFARWLTLEGRDEWRSQARFPYIEVGEAGVFNVTAETGALGVEIRPIPQDDVRSMLEDIRGYAETRGLELHVVAAEDGVACDLVNPYLRLLIEAVAEVGKAPPRLGSKLPATSARFAPGGQGVVWGQSGIGPHAPDERHFLPSIVPYLRSLDAFALLLLRSANPLGTS